jgi:ATP-binding cassette subfamily C (CFTR/MRP) protein 1
VVFAAFSIESKVKNTEPLTTGKAFSSLAILLLLNTPAVALLNSFPTTLAALGCVKRIQTFLESEDFQDPRSFTTGKSRFSPISEKNEMLHEKMLHVSDLHLAPRTKEDLPQSSINFSVDSARFTLVLGPVGSGKSTILKAMLGEIGDNHRSSGKVEATSPFMAYCAQTPWLQNGSIRNNIVGPSDFDGDWYYRVLWLCDLTKDIAQMPNGDLSEAGSRGITLSGGQKHRIVSVSANKRSTPSNGITSRRWPGHSIRGARFYCWTTLYLLWTPIPESPLHKGCSPEMDM